MVKTKGLSRTKKNWEGAIPSVARKYSDGVDDATDVISRSKAAEERWKEAITEAAARGARGKGLDKVSDADWKRAAKEKGMARIGPGMQASKDKYSSRMGEVLSVIEGITLPERTLDPETNVMNRVVPIAKELNEWKKR